MQNSMFSFCLLRLKAFLGKWLETAGFQEAGGEVYHCPEKVSLC